MLTKLVVSIYASVINILIEIALWLFLIASLVIGWNVGDGFFGAVLGLIAGFVFSVIVFGAFLMLLDIRKTVKALEAKNQNTV